MTRSYKDRSEVLQALIVCNDNSKSVLQNICKLKPKLQIYGGIIALIEELNDISIAKIREIMFNTIQYRDGKIIAQSIDEIKGISTSTKTNFLTQGSESQVFNPHMQGPNINSPSHAFFDDELPPVQEPFLPECDYGTYTLVLDLDETLVHYFDLGPDSHFKIRPGCHEFLEEMSNYYELVIFTAAMQDYADSVLDQIDKKGSIQYRLYRQHTSPHGHLIAKDLSKLGRDLTRCILLDNVADNFALQPENGIFIKTWYDDMSDTCLMDLIPLLKGLVENQVKDVRKSLRNYRDQMLRHITAGVQNPHTLLNG